jgi:hypothetical protein
LPIPFRNLEEDEPSRVAGFLRFIDEPEGRGIRGALFIMSARGEPIEFAFTRIDLRSRVFWRPGYQRVRAVSTLARALFQSTSNQPDVVLALAAETPSAVFSDEISPEIPLCRVAPQGSPDTVSSEAAQPVAGGLTLYWVCDLPPSGSPPAETVELLDRRRMLLEPFERAATGIQEVFNS